MWSPFHKFSVHIFKIVNNCNSGLPFKYPELCLMPINLYCKKYFIMWSVIFNSVTLKQTEIKVADQYFVSTALPPCLSSPVMSANKQSIGDFFCLLELSCIGWSKLSSCHIRWYIPSGPNDFALFNLASLVSMSLIPNAISLMSAQSLNGIESLFYEPSLLKTLTK